MPKPQAISNLPHSTNRARSRNSKNSQPAARRNSKDKITQRELQVIHSLRMLDAHYKELRDNIVARLEDNAPVEGGDLIVKFDQKVSRTITFDRLVEVVGEEKACRIREEIPLSTHSYLKVTHR